MARKRAGGRKAGRADVHLTMDADLHRRVRAYVGYHGGDLSGLVERALKPLLKGFSVRQEPPRDGPRLADGPDAGGEQDAA